MRGSMASTDAMARRCFWPPERVAGVRFSNPSRRTCLSTVSTLTVHLVTLDGEVFRPESDLQGHVGGEQLGLEVLEDEPHLLGELADPPSRVEQPPTRTSPSILPLKKWGIKPFKETQSVLFPAPRRPHHDHEPLGHLEVHPSERRPCHPCNGSPVPRC